MEPPLIEEPPNVTIFLPASPPAGPAVDWALRAALTPDFAGTCDSADSQDLRRTLIRGTLPQLFAVIVQVML